MHFQNFKINDMLSLNKIIIYVNNDFVNETLYLKESNPDYELYIDFLNGFQKSKDIEVFLPVVDFLLSNPTNEIEKFIMEKLGGFDEHERYGAVCVLGGFEYRTFLFYKAITQEAFLEHSSILSLHIKVDLQDIHCLLEEWMHILLIFKR